MNNPYFINQPENSIPQNLTTSIFKESNSWNFHKSLSAYKPTPLKELSNLAEFYNVGNIFVKDESYRFGLNAFKGLGASYAVHRILEKDPSIATFCTATDGNHGRAVAWSAALHGKNSQIYVPRDTTKSRIEAIAKEGARVEKIDGNYEEATALAKKMSEENGWKLVQDAAWDGYEEIPAFIKAGYFTHFKELENSIHRSDIPEVDIVFLQSGVGSWPAAAAWYYHNRYGAKRPKLVVVEPKEAAGFLVSLEKGHRASPDGNYKTIMAGLNCGIPSLTAWEILKGTIDAAIAIEDSFTEQAIRKFYFPQGQDEKIISGESGAGGFAGFIAIMTDPRYKELKQKLQINSGTKILLYNTEGNTDPENFQKIIARDQIKGLQNK